MCVDVSVCVREYVQRAHVFWVDVSNQSLPSLVCVNVFVSCYFFVLVACVIVCVSLRVDSQQATHRHTHTQTEKTRGDDI